MIFEHGKRINKVEGSFMHVDTIVQDDELLPWSEDLSTKPKS